VPITVTGLLDAIDEEDPRPRDPVEDVYMHPLLIADPVKLPPKDVCSHAFLHVSADNLWLFL
jgi:hypothetical protein